MTRFDKVGCGRCWNGEGMLGRYDDVVDDGVAVVASHLLEIRGGDVNENESRLCV
jgi:hypothetical protein